MGQCSVSLDKVYGTCYSVPHDRYFCEGCMDSKMKQQVLSERGMGNSIRQIAEKHGISKSTVHRVLQEKDSLTKEEREVYNLSISSGVSHTTERKIMGEGYSSESRKAVRRKLVNVANKEGEKALFIPDWLEGDEPREKRDAMLELADDLFNRIEEYVQDFLWEHSMDQSKHSSVKHALLTMVVAGYNPIPLEAYLNNIDNVVIEMEKRNGK